MGPLTPCTIGTPVEVTDCPSNPRYTYNAGNNNFDKEKYTFLQSFREYATIFVSCDNGEKHTVFSIVVSFFQHQF